MPIVLMLSMVFAFQANAATASKCLVRANVSGAEVLELTGGQGTVSGSGEVVRNTSLSIIDVKYGGSHALICTYSLVLFFTNLLFLIVVVAAVFFFALSAFMFVTAGANPGKRTKAKEFFIYALVGLGVAALAQVIPAITRGLIGLS